MNHLETFTGGNPETRRKLNAMVDEIRRLQKITGDGLIQVKHSAAGVGLNLSIGHLLPRLWRKRNAAFAVMVTKTNGVSGGAAAECTYAYTVKDLAEVTTLGTGKTPQTPRLHYCAYWYAGEDRGGDLGTTSRYGLACYSTSGSLILLHCFGELAKDGPC